MKSIGHLFVVDLVNAAQMRSSHVAEYSLHLMFLARVWSRINTNSIRSDSSAKLGFKLYSIKV